MPSHDDRPSRLAIGFVVLGLALSAVGIAYIIYAGRARELPPVNTQTEMARVQQYRALYRMLMHSFFLFLAFLLGSYVMIRLGRVVMRASTPENSTEYVDAWGAYRLSQDDIDTASARLDEDFPPDTPPPEPPPELDGK